MMWAQRICSNRHAPAHQLLEIKKDASLEDAQAAFHKIARIAHPDLHRNTLSPDELEMLTTAYATVANAYQSFRTQTAGTPPIRPIKPADTTARVPVTPSGAAPAAAGAAQQMSTKAVVYYRKAELALKRGDLRGATLQLKLAIAADPQSPFLRTALAEVEAELQKG
ncbi:MAG: hypothetical protein ACM31C_09600 [Acidobacteriota bacterium]